MKSKNVNRQIHIRNCILLVINDVRLTEIGQNEIIYMDNKIFNKLAKFEYSMDTLICRIEKNWHYYNSIMEILLSYSTKQYLTAKSLQKTTFL